jgi:G:T/U-mismatch repair DNA glycosylase
MNLTEIHPWNYYIPKNCKILIVGTFPPMKRNWNYDFFYPNKANFFWKTMAEIAAVNLIFFSGEDAVNERKQILQTLRVGVTDMACKIVRNNNNSLDENLELIEFMDIFKILNENQEILKLIFTSRSGKANAAKWFCKYLETKNIRHKFPKDKKPFKSEFLFENRKIQTVITYSTSARAANRISFDKLVELYKIELQDF